LAWRSGWLFASDGRHPHSYRYHGASFRRDGLAAGGAGAAPASTNPGGLFWGAFSGFMSFASQGGGPPFQVYTLPQRLPK